jgi:hypothetical protein
MTYVPKRLAREESIEVCLNELQRRANFHNVPELVYALSYARQCLKAILRNAEHSELADLFEAAYGEDIKEFVPRCVNEEVREYLRKAGDIGIDENDDQLRSYVEFFCILGLVLRVHALPRTEEKREQSTTEKSEAIAKGLQGNIPMEEE